MEDYLRWRWSNGGLRIPLTRTRYIRTHATPAKDEDNASTNLLPKYNAIPTIPFTYTCGHHRSRHMPECTTIIYSGEATGKGLIAQDGHEEIGEESLRIRPWGCNGQKKAAALTWLAALCTLVCAPGQTSSVMNGYSTEVPLCTE